MGDARCCQEIYEMKPRLAISLMVKAFDGRIMDGAAHPLDRTLALEVVLRRDRSTLNYSVT